MSQTLSLFRLQQTDNQIDRINQRLLTIQKILEDDVALRQASDKFITTETHLHSCEKQVKEAERAVQDQRIKLEQTEAALYGGKGFSPKELQDLQNDVAALKRRLSQLEDEQLNAMLSVEAAETLFHQAQSELDLEKDQSRVQGRDLLDEQSALQKELNKLNSERLANSGSITPEALGLYDRLRQQRRGIAVAAISDKACSACGSGLSPAQIQSSRTPGQMILCPSCGRILYGN